jgi:hypothetical protein
MRGVLTLIALLAASPAAAAPLVMSEDQPIRFDNLPGTQSHLRRQVVDETATAVPFAQRNMSDQIAAQFGVENGQMAVFHRRVETGSDRGASLDGGIDGSGFRLKLSW